MILDLFDSYSKVCLEQTLLKARTLRGSGLRFSQAGCISESHILVTGCGFRILGLYSRMLSRSHKLNPPSPQSPAFH